MRKFQQLKTWQKVTCVAALAAIVAGAAGATAYVILHNDSQETTTASVLTSADFDDENVTELKLTEGKNKIKSGGVYHVTGNISEGYITINTTEDVKLILDNVTLTSSDNQVIRSKETNSVLIQLVGENNLTAAVSETEDTKPAISVEGTVSIEGDGALNINSTGKGIKAIDTISISSGTINIEKSYEGLEANTVEIKGGDVSIVASDDGINGADNTEDGRYSTSQSAMGGEAVTESKVIISGGTLYINAAGDGIDSNGDVEISGGTTYVDGPTSSADGALDYNGSMTITGGTLVAVGASGMAMNASSATQPSVLINLSGTYSGKLSFGGIEYTPSKSYQSVVVSSPDLQVGSTYELVINGSTVQSVTISDYITGQGSGMMGGGGMMGGQGGGDDRQGQSQGGGTPPSGGPGGR